MSDFTTEQIDASIPRYLILPDGTVLPDGSDGIVMRHRRGSVCGYEVHGQDYVLEEPPVRWPYFPEEGGTALTIRLVAAGPPTH